MRDEVNERGTRIDFILDELREAYAVDNARRCWPMASGMPAAAGTLVCAELELLRVHQDEVARVLSRAVQLLDRRVHGARVRAFQRRAALTLASARAAGACVPSLAAKIVALGPEAWPAREHLARAAFALDPSLDHEAMLAGDTNPESNS